MDVNAAAVIVAFGLFDSIISSRISLCVSHTQTNTTYCTIDANDFTDDFLCLKWERFLLEHIGMSHVFLD